MKNSEICHHSFSEVYNNVLNLIDHSRKPQEKSFIIAVTPKSDEFFLRHAGGVSKASFPND